MWLCLQAALISLVLPAWMCEMCARRTWPTDAYTHNLSGINFFFVLALVSSSLSSYCLFAVLQEKYSQNLYETLFFFYDIKYIYGHIVPINFISLNSFSAITCLHTYTLARLTMKISYAMERTRSMRANEQREKEKEEKKQYLTLSDNYVYVIPTRKQNKRKQEERWWSNLAHILESRKKKETICIESLSACVGEPGWAWRQEI